MRLRVWVCVSGKPQARLFAQQSTSLSPGKSLCERVMAEKAERTKKDRIPCGYQKDPKTEASVSRRNKAMLLSRRGVSVEDECPTLRQSYRAAPASRCCQWKRSWAIFTKN